MLTWGLIILCTYNLNLLSEFYGYRLKQFQLKELRDSVKEKDLKIIIILHDIQNLVHNVVFTLKNNDEDD